MFWKRMFSKRAHGFHTWNANSTYFFWAQSLSLLALGHHVDGAYCPCVLLAYFSLDSRPTTHHGHHANDGQHGHHGQIEHPKLVASGTGHCDTAPKTTFSGSSVPSFRTRRQLICRVTSKSSDAPLATWKKPAGFAPMSFGFQWTIYRNPWFDHAEEVNAEPVSFIRLDDEAWEKVDMAPISKPNLLRSPRH